MANSSSHFILEAHFSKVLVYLFVNEILGFQNPLVDGIEEFEEHEDVAWCIQKRVACVCCRALEVRQEERLLYLLGLSLSSCDLQIHLAELLGWFC